MTDPLEGLMGKLGRAEELLHEVKDGVNGFLHDLPFTPQLEVDRAGRVVVRVADLRTPPPGLSIRIGECVYAYRSALDHLAYRLAVLHSGEPLPERIARTSAFPIFSSGPRFRREAQFRIRGMSPQSRAIVERMQPYHRRVLPQARALLALEQLNNVDKHRDLHPTGSVLASTQFAVSGTGFLMLSKIEGWPNELHERAMLARFTGRFDMENGEVEFSMPNVRFDVIFGKACAAPAARGRSVLVVLLEIREFVMAILMPAFAEQLGIDYRLEVSAPE